MKRKVGARGCTLSGSVDSLEAFLICNKLKVTGIQSRLVPFEFGKVCSVESNFKEYILVELLTYRSRKGSSSK